MRGSAAGAARGLAKINACRRERAAIRRAVKLEELVALLAKLEPGETLCQSYDASGALCDCEPTHLWYSFLPCIAVGRSRTSDRCLSCGTAWTRRIWTWETAQLVARKAA